MDLDERLLADMQDAMRTSDKLRREMLRMLRAALHYEAVARRGPLDEATATEVMQRELKKRQEAIELYRQGGRQDLVEKTEGEMAIISSYLPQQLSTEEVERLARQAIFEAGASDPRQMGQVMKVLIPKVKGRAQGKVVSEMVRRLLSQSAEASPTPSESGPVED